jgi:formate dehydrogenase maturation protein FdhE
MIVHDIEQGHSCPKCGSKSVCTREDGYCENVGLCETCRQDWAYERVRRDLDGESFEFESL